MTSVITPTTNTNQQGDIAISTIQEQATVSPFRLISDNQISNRTKVARLAKNAMSFDLVESVAVGQFFAKTAATYPDHREACVVRYHEGSIHDLATRAGSLFVVYAAYFNRDEAIAFEYATSEDKTPRYLYDERGLANGGVVVGGKEYHPSDIRGILLSLVYGEGDQAGLLNHRITKQNEERAAHLAHLAAVAEAHEKRSDNSKYNAGYILSKAERVGDVISEDGWKTEYAERKELLNTITAHYQRHLFTICQDLNQVRCEATYISSRGMEDPYGFVTVGEVTAYILTRWVGDGFGDVERGIRNAVAQEFVRSHLS